MSSIGRCCVCVGLLLLCVGCKIPTTKNPLVEPSEAKPFSGLYGAFRSTDRTDDDLQYVHMGPAGNGYPAGFLQIISVSHSNDSKSSDSKLSDSKSSLVFEKYVGFVYPMGRYAVLHIPLPKTKKEANKPAFWDREWDQEQVGGYMIMRLLVSPDSIEMCSLNEEFVMEKILSKKLAGRVDQGAGEREPATTVKIQTVTITADADALRQFFTKYMDDKLFDDPQWKLTRLH